MPSSLDLVRKHGPSCTDSVDPVLRNDDFDGDVLTTSHIRDIASAKSHSVLHPYERLADHHKRAPQHHASGVESLSANADKSHPTSCVNHLPEYTTPLTELENSGRLVSTERQTHCLLFLGICNVSSYL
jgi:hypothetical protein